MYIGHTTLEGFVSKVAPGQVLYLNCLEELHPGHEGLDLPCCYLLLQSGGTTGQPEGTVLYWRMSIGELLAPGGVSWEHQHALVRKAGRSERLTVKDFLQQQLNAGRIEEGAVIALPRDLKMVAGKADCLSFDKMTHSYGLKEPAKQALAASKET